MIREARIDDIEFINECLEKFNTSEVDVLNSINRYYIYEVDLEKVGFLDYSFYYDRIEINYIFIKDGYRKNGIASNLLKYLINSYKNSYNITLEVSKNNTAAIKLYEKNGFNIVATRKNYYGANVDAYLMERKL